MKAYIASTCCSKALNIGGTNLTQANYGNISSEIRLIDSLKFYQKSLAELSSTLTAKEKIAVKKLAKKFLNEHSFFDCLAIFEFEKERENFRNYIRRQRSYTI